MTTRDFIAKRYNVAGQEQWCSSVFADSGGFIYSYGYHYPLAFNIGGYDFVNEAGYSTTTGKHIAWARQALNYQYIGVKLSRDDRYTINSGYASDNDKLAVIRGALERELKTIMDKMEGKPRKDTRVYEQLKDEHERVYNLITKLEVV